MAFLALHQAMFLVYLALCKYTLMELLKLKLKVILSGE